MPQQKIGWRPYVNPSTLWASVFSVWNGEGTNNLTVKNAWNANGNIVDSKSGANGTIVAPSGTTFVTGTMSFGSGKLGSGAITFSGTNFVSLPNGTLTFTGDFSASFWVYVPTSFGTNYSRVLSAFDNSAGYTGYKGWDTSYSNGKMSLYIYPGLSTDYYGITVPMTLKDQWVHVTVTKVLGQQGNIYINGVAGVKTVDQRGSGASTQAIAYNVSNLAYMGASYFAFSTPYYTPTVAGGFKIDAIQTWDGVALDQTAVTELYNSGNGQEYPFTLSNALIPTYKDAVGTNHGTTPASTITNGVTGPTFTTGKIGKAFTFDGVNDYIQLPNNSLQVSNSFSVSFWVKANTSQPTAVILSSYNISPNRGWYLGFNYGNIYMAASTDGVTNFSVGSAGAQIILNTWVHVVCTVEVGVGSNIYCNGALIATNTTYKTLPSYNNPTYTAIGCFNFNATGRQEYFNGSIDGLTMWNKVLNAGEASSLYNGGLGAEYPFSSKTLSTTADVVGSNHGTTPLSTLNSNVPGPTFTTGKIGQAFTFDGVNDFIQLPNNSMNFTGDFSISAWLYFPTDIQLIGSDYSHILSNWTAVTWTSNLAGWRFDTSGNTIYFTTYNGTSTSVSLVTGSGVPALDRNGWRHIVFTRTGTTYKLWLDGGQYTATSTTMLVPKYQGTIIPKIGRAGDSTMGGWDSYSSAKIKIDSVSTWQKALTATEIAELYNSGNGKQYPN